MRVEKDSLTLHLRDSCFGARIRGRVFHTDSYGRVCEASGGYDLMDQEEDGIKYRQVTETVPTHRANGSEKKFNKKRERERNKKINMLIGSFSSFVIRLCWLFFLTICPITINAYKAKATWYNTGLGACGKTSSDDQLVVALPASIASSKCFQTVSLTNAARPIGPKITATVVDKCMGCDGMDIDISPAAFKALNLGDLGAGKIFVEWTYI